MLEQFLAFNKKHYVDYGEDHGKFINDFHRSIGSPNIYSQYEVKQWKCVYNIPVLVVKILPWDDPSDDLWVGGNFHHLGIVTSETKDVIQVIDNEIIHAINFWLRRGKIFKTNTPLTSLQQVFLPSLSLFEVVLERFRDESIAYLLSAPGEIGKRDEDFIVRSLTGRDKAVLASKLKNQDFELILGLCKVAKKVDSGVHNMVKISGCFFCLKFSLNSKNKRLILKN